MANEPERVELYEDDQLKLVLTKSEPGSLNGRKGEQGRTYKGTPSRARIVGKAGSVVTFYDDQKFKTGENHLRIEKKTNVPIDVNIASNFIKTELKQGDGIFQGETAEFKWTLFKSVKDPSFWQRVGADLGNWLQKNMVGTEFYHIDSGGNVSNNYKIDNCSSLKFGG